MTRSPRRMTAIAALLAGIGLLAWTLRHVDIRSIGQLSRLFGLALPLVLVPSAAWHLLRTAAWHRSFPDGSRIPFGRMFRVRLAAEAFSYLTFSGVAGEPLKVVLIAPSVAPATAAAAIALERVAYLIVTAAIVGASALAASFTLPLTPQWAHAFAWIGGAAAGIAIVPVILLMRRRPALQPPSLHQASRRKTRVRRFLYQIAREFRDLAQGDRQRLAILLTIEAAAFVMMILEVFAALWLTGSSITLMGALAIEAFTRVVSVAAVVIPGNLGALEASNIAVATAVHATGGAIALALVRRVRGLIWCAAGLLLYPRIRSVNDRAAVTHDVGRTLASVQGANSDETISEELGGMPVGERIARAALRAGYTRLLVWTRRPLEWRAAVRRLGGRLEIVATSDPDVWDRQWTGIDRRSPITVLAPGVAASPQLLESARTIILGPEEPLVEAPAGAGFPESGVFRVTVDRIVAPRAAAQAMRSTWSPEPSGREVAGGSAFLSLRFATRESLAIAERRLRASIFKPTDGRLGRFNRRFSLPISVVLIRRGRLSAHTMSLFVTLLGLYAGWLFSRGTYATGVIAAAISWGASVLDGCDGELARLQFKESAFGCWVDTLGDYVYYLAIFAGLTMGAVRQTGSPALWWCGAALGVGVCITFVLLILLRWRSTDGRPERLRTQTKAHFYGTGKRWARIVARLSTCATRATMPYGIVAFAVLGLLPVVVVLGAVGAQIFWISLATQFRRLVKASPAPAFPASTGSPYSSPAPRTVGRPLTNA